MFATSSTDGTVKIYDTHNSKLVRSLTISSPVYSAIFSRNGRYLLTGSKDSIGRLWDITSGKVLMEYSGASQSTASVSMSFTYNEDFVVGSDENSYGIVLWDTRNGTFLKKILGHSGRIRSFASSPVNDGFVSCSEDAKVKYWDVI
jgi:cleavage stimulation factor subunit 1